MELQIIRGDQWADDVARLLRDLPEWFGIEESNRGDVASAHETPMIVAVHEGRVVGACLVRQHSGVAAEIELLAVERSQHRRGIGRQLVAALIDDLRDRGVAVLQVKTRGPSAPSEEYERTRAFYEALGFLPREERTDISGPENRCLIMVTPLPLRVPR